MAASSNRRGITSLGKRVIGQIWTANPPFRTRSSVSSAPSLTTRSATYSTVYEKNPDDQVHSSAVPDDVIGAAQSEKYWAPHPQTGVFGPAAAHINPPTTAAAGGERSFRSASATTPTDADAGSVLEERAWFRPTSLEDLEKPQSEP